MHYTISDVGYPHLLKCHALATSVFILYTSGYPSGATLIFTITQQLTEKSNESEQEAFECVI